MEGEKRQNAKKTTFPVDFTLVLHGRASSSFCIEISRGNWVVDTWSVYCSIACLYSNSWNDNFFSSFLRSFSRLFLIFFSSLHLLLSIRSSRDHRSRQNRYSRHDLPNTRGNKSLNFVFFFTRVFHCEFRSRSRVTAREIIHFVFQCSLQCSCLMKKFSKALTSVLMFV